MLKFSCDVGGIFFVVVMFLINWWIILIKKLHYGLHFKNIILIKGGRTEFSVVKAKYLKCFKCLHASILKQFLNILNIILCLFCYLKTSPFQGIQLFLHNSYTSQKVFYKDDNRQAFFLISNTKLKRIFIKDIFFMPIFE